MLVRNPLKKTRLVLAGFHLRGTLGLKHIKANRANKTPPKEPVKFAKRGMQQTDFLGQTKKAQSTQKPPAPRLKWFLSVYVLIKKNPAPGSVEPQNGCLKPTTNPQRPLSFHTVL
ncbi:hypothetical protein NHP190009_09290 [Helicobacter ailurogastricus]|nr:hypothetical protein NHP190009_09290 [Helicobacter ailurogastricus]